MPLTVVLEGTIQEGRDPGACPDTHTRGSTDVYTYIDIHAHEYIHRYIETYIDI